MNPFHRLLAHLAALFAPSPSERLQPIPIPSEERRRLAEERARRRWFRQGAPRAGRSCPFRPRPCCGRLSR